MQYWGIIIFWFIKCWLSRANCTLFVNGLVTCMNTFLGALEVVFSCVLICSIYTLWKAALNKKVATSSALPVSPTLQPIHEIHKQVLWFLNREVSGAFRGFRHLMFLGCVWVPGEHSYPHPHLAWGFSHSGNILIPEHPIMGGSGLFFGGLKWDFTPSLVCPEGFLAQYSLLTGNEPSQSWISYNPSC